MAGAPAFTRKRRRMWPGVDTLSAWLVAAFLIALGALAKHGLDDFAGEPLPPYITVYPPVALAALAGGPRIGVMTGLVTLALAWYFFVPDYGSFAIASRGAALTLIIYSVTATVLGLVVGQARLALDRSHASEAQRDHAARESVHRIKNLLAVVQALAHKIARETETAREFREVLINRLASLDAAQNMLLKRDWHDLPLAEMVEQALAPFLPSTTLTVRGGPEAIVPARHVSGLCMALYELATNAAKYGAVSEGGQGAVVLSWRLEERSVVLEWDECTSKVDSRGGGFGAQLVRAALSGDAATHVDYSLTEDRIRAVFTWRDDRAGATAYPVIDREILH